MPSRFADLLTTDRRPMSKAPPQAICCRRHASRRRAGNPATLVLVCLCLAMVGCATSEAYKKAETAAAAEDWDAAIAYYQTALSDNPDRIEYEIKLQRAKVNAARQHRAVARRFYDAGQLASAIGEYQLAVQLNPSDQVAQTELRQVSAAASVGEAIQPAMTPLERTVRDAQRTILELPRLKPQVDRISLWYPSASIKSIWRSLAQVGGLNVVFDQDVQDRQTSFELDEEMPFEQVLTLLASVHGQFVKAISAETFIVVPDSADKRAQYEDEVLRTFFLSNAQVQEVAALLRSVLDSNSISENPSTNSITVRDSPEVMALAARLIATADKSPGEVLLEIEVLEVDRRTLREYGVSLSSYDITQGLAQGDGGQEQFVRRARRVALLARRDRRVGYLLRQQSERGTR